MLAFARSAKLDLIAIDDLRYLPLADIGAEMPHRLIAERAARPTALMTTDAPLFARPNALVNSRARKAQMIGDA